MAYKINKSQNKTHNIYLSFSCENFSTFIWCSKIWIGITSYAYAVGSYFLIPCKIMNP